MHNIDAASQDRSLPILNQLLSEGFDEVEWKWNGQHTDICFDLDGQKWPLKEFISNLRHRAPIFEKSHVNCLCKLIVRNTVTGEEKEVDYMGFANDI